MLNKKQFSNIEAKLCIIQDASDRIKRLPVANIPVTRGLVFSYDQAGNEPRAISCLKDSIFVSKELLDLLLVKLNKADSRINKKYKNFILGLAKGKFDQFEKTRKEINFLKNNIRFIHGLREIRNRLKGNYGNIKVYLKNQKYFIKIDLGFNSTCLEIPNYKEIMQIKNYDKALKNKKYYVEVEIDGFINEQLNFWQILLKNSKIFS